MKKRLLDGLVNVFVLAVVLGLGIGAYHLWNTVQFQKQYEENILKSQNQQIETACETIWEEKEAEKEMIEEE